MKKSPNPIDKAVGARVRLARLELGKSQEWLAEQLGLTFQQVQKYERGKNRIASSRMVQIADALERPVAWFYQGSEINAKRNPDADLVTQMLTAPGGMNLAKNYLAIKHNADRHVVAQVADALAQQR